MKFKNLSIIGGGPSCICIRYFTKKNFKKKIKLKKK